LKCGGCLRAKSEHSGANTRPPSDGANLYAAHTEEVRLCLIAAGIVKVAGFFVIDPGGLETIAQRIP
jgi:hypothetical protein